MLFQTKLMTMFSIKIPSLELYI